MIKQTKRIGCGYRNMINYQRRILMATLRSPDRTDQQHERDQPRLSS